jgi:serine/threonine-protein kinase
MMGPQIVGRYALYAEIASGGMATVHFGRLLGPVGFSRPVAIKRLHPQYARDPSFARMFLDEARIASRVIHPNVVSTHDVVQDGAELLLVMEYVRGESLARLLRTAKGRGQEVPIPVALAIMSNVLHGLHAAHEARSELGEALDVVHRDVSPQNVLVGTDGTARVLDFGIARARWRVEATEEGRIKGKIAYMSPEQLAGATVDRRTDIYAAAQLLWELLAGRRLFTRAEPEAMLMDKIFRRIDRPSLYREEIPDALDAISLHGLARDPDKRFGTAHEMALAIEKYGLLASQSEVGAWVEAMAHEAISERSLKIAEFESTPPVALDLVPAEPCVSATPEAPTELWRRVPPRRRPRHAAILAACVCFVASVFAWHLHRPLIRAPAAESCAPSLATPAIPRPPDAAALDAAPRYLAGSIHRDDEARRTRDPHRQ